MKFTKGMGLSLLAHGQDSVLFLNQFKVDEVVEITGKKTGGITNAQRGATHVYFEKLAKHLNDQNFPMQAVFSQRPDVDWDMDKVKSLYRDLAFAMYDVESTEDLEPAQVSKVYEKLSHFLATKVGVPDLPEFPAWHNQGE